MKKEYIPPFLQLIDPVPVQQFWDDLFEKQYCFFESQLQKIDFSLRRFEYLLWAHEDTLDQKVQLNHKGEDIELHRKTSGKDWFRFCLDRYYEGATIIFNGIDEIDPEAAKFARAIDAVFNGRLRGI